MPEPTAPASSVRWKWIAAGLAVVAVVVGARYFPLQETLRQALATIEQWGAWGAVLFVALYVVATVLLIPGSVLTLGAGAAFGVVWGSLLVSLSSTLGATCAFLVGRHLARDTVRRKVEGDERFAAIDRAVGEQGWKIVGLTRLSPVFPFTLLNYAFGLTQVKLGHYVLASWIGMMPGTVMYVYLGSLARAAAGARERTPGEWALYGLGLAATVAVTVIITRIARRALRRRLDT
jgi:uncharacterized membrane protein YdjX (TVP38/TMEM64 family)